MFLETELYSLVIFTIGAGLLTVLLRSCLLPGCRWFMAGYALALCANFFTVVEGFAFYDFFNFLEHLSLAASSICFCAAVQEFVNGIAGDEKVQKQP